MIEEQERAGITGWEPKALEYLQSYAWPGNVRELRNVVHRAYVMTEGKLIRPDVVESLIPKTDRISAAPSKKKTAAKPQRAGGAARRR